MLGSPTQRLRGWAGPEGGLISERFEDGSTGDDAPHPPHPPLAVLPPTQNPIPDESVRLNGLRGAQSPGASDTAEPRSSTRPSGRNPPCPVLSCVAQGWAGVCRMDAGCWMLDAGAHWDADCLGQGIRVGSWLADLFCCCTYNHVPPNFLNKTPIVYLFLLASARFSYSKLRLSLPATHHHCLRASWAPIFLLPGFLPRRHTTRSRDLLPFLYDPPPHHARLASHLIPRASGSRTSPGRLGSRANHHRPASLGSRCHRASTGLSPRIPPVPEIWLFLRRNYATASRGERR